MWGLCTFPIAHFLPLLKVDNVEKWTEGKIGPNVALFLFVCFVAFLAIVKKKIVKDTLYYSKKT